MIPVAYPDLTGNERRYVDDCVASSWVSSVGRYIGEFEQEFAKVAGSRHVIATNNGTTALHLALAALGIGPGDEVVVPALPPTRALPMVAARAPCPGVRAGRRPIDRKSVV